MPKSSNERAKAAAFARAMTRNVFGKNFVSDDQLREIRRASSKTTKPSRPFSKGKLNTAGGTDE